MALPVIAAGVLQAGFILALGKLVFKLLQVFGVGFVSYQGIDLVLTEVQGYINASIGGVPANLIAILDTMNVFSAINLLISALSIRLRSSGPAANCGSTCQRVPARDCLCDRRTGKRQNALDDL